MTSKQFYEVLDLAATLLEHVAPFSSQPEDYNAAASMLRAIDDGQLGIDLK